MKKQKGLYVLIIVLCFFLITKYILAFETPAQKQQREFREEGIARMESFYTMSCDELEEYIKQKYYKIGGDHKGSEYTILFGILHTRLIKGECN